MDLTSAPPSSSSEPPSKRRKTMSPSEPNDDSSVFISDEDCKTFDASPELEQYMGHPNNLAQLTGVLHTVARLDNNIHADFRDFAKAKDFLFSRSDLQSIIQSCCNSGKFKELRCSKELRGSLDPPIASIANVDATEDQQAATVNSWSHNFRGETVIALRNTIKSFLSVVRANVYAPYTAIINSSGTGKSRLVDELGKKVVVVYMCLRGEESSGFPPADKALRNWLLALDVTTEEQARNRTSSLVYALLVVTLSKLKEIEARTDCPTDHLGRYEYLASQFRERMVEGQQFSESNKYRRDFYDEVIAEGKAFEKRSPRIRSEGGTRGIHPVYIQSLQGSKEKDISEAADTIYTFLDPSQATQTPALVLSFDESYDLTTRPRKQSSWTIFSSLRRALRDTRGKSIFSLFLSTAGKYQEFSPEAALDPSSRIQEESLTLLPAIPEVGFDELAHIISEDKFKLNDVATLDHMAHLGRPLFGSRFDAGEDKVRKDLVQFAQLKLTGQSKTDDLDFNAALACLAVRFALEFRPRLPKERLIELRQVERHMRICLSASPGYQTIVTTAASEPLLAEAAEQALPYSQVPGLLADTLEKSGVHRGDRGELAAMVIVMAARDKARKQSSSNSEKRAFFVLDFMRALLPESYHDTLSNATPSVSASKEFDKTTFAEAFKDSRMWFNHFIKVEDFAMINDQFLWILMSRGSAVFCADNQRGIDILLPVLYRDGTLCRRNMTAILLQVKNDALFGYNVNQLLFDAMDPSGLDIFSDPAKVKTTPVIRLVFALAAARPPSHIVNPPSDLKSAVQVISAPPCKSPRKRPKSRCVSWDIWFAGVSDKAFGVVETHQEKKYKAIMGRAYGNDYAYAVDDDTRADNNEKEERGKIRRRMNPATRSSVDHIGRYIQLSGGN